MESERGHEEEKGFGVACFSFGFGQFGAAGFRTRCNRGFSWITPPLRSWLRTAKWSEPNVQYGPGYFTIVTIPAQERYGDQRALARQARPIC
jgi:hypothetical protein